MTNEKNFTSMDDLIDSIYNDVTKQINFDTNEKYQVTNSGAKVLKKGITQSIISHGHVRHGKYAGEYKHLKDSVSTSKKDENGMRTGAMRVGFDAHHAHIGRFLNDGTKHIAADHFVDDARMNSRQNVADVMKNKIKEIQDGR